MSPITVCGGLRNNFQAISSFWEQFHQPEHTVFGTFSDSRKFKCQNLLSFVMCLEPLVVFCTRYWTSLPLSASDMFCAYLASFCSYKTLRHSYAGCLWFLYFVFLFLYTDHSFFSFLSSQSPTSPPIHHMQAFV